MVGGGSGVVVVSVVSAEDTVAALDHADVLRVLLALLGKDGGNASTKQKENGTAGNKNTEIIRFSDISKTETTKI